MAVMAGAVITVLPIVLIYLAAQRAFVRGVALSGLKQPVTGRLYPRGYFSLRQSEKHHLYYC